MKIWSCVCFSSVPWHSEMPKTNHTFLSRSWTIKVSAWRLRTMFCNPLWVFFCHGTQNLQGCDARESFLYLLPQEYGESCIPVEDGFKEKRDFDKCFVDVPNVLVLKKHDCLLLTDPLKDDMKFRKQRYQLLYYNQVCKVQLNLSVEMSLCVTWNSSTNIAGWRSLREPKWATNISASSHVPPTRFRKLFNEN